uniref:Uncharacterized protein n=1 Tax=viral metagenome TaxID=1070528 RepID=A0A6M3LRZ5_9ZZZZ
MKIRIGKYELENDVDIKSIPDGWEIFGTAVEKLGISPSDFDSAYWQDRSIIIEII